MKHRALVERRRCDSAVKEWKRSFRECDGDGVDRRGGRGVEYLVGRRRGVNPTQRRRVSMGQKARIDARESKMAWERTSHLPCEA